MRGRVLLFALVVALVCDAGLIFIGWRFGLGPDFAVFWRAVRSSEPYAYSAHPFGSPPPALLLLSPLRLLPLWPAYVLVSAGGLVAFLWAAWRLYGRVSLLALVSPAAMFAFIAGQLSFIVAAMVFGAFLAGPVVSGVLLGLAVWLKPQMAFLAPLLLLLTKRGESLLYFCVTFVAGALIATQVFGPGVWSQWVAGTQNLVSVAGGRGALAMAVSPASYGIPLALCLVLGSGALYLSRDLPKPKQAAMLVACSLLASPYALSYDLVAIGPLAFLMALTGSVGGALAFTAALGPLSLLGSLHALQRERDADNIDGRERKGDGFSGLSAKS